MRLIIRIITLTKAETTHSSTYPSFYSSDTIDKMHYNEKVRCKEDEGDDDVGDDDDADLHNRMDQLSL